MSFWTRIKEFFTGVFSGESVDFTGGQINDPSEYEIEDNGLPSGWHFVGYVDNDGTVHHIGDEITDQQVRDCDRVFIAKDFNGRMVYRQFSSANSKDAIGDMLIRESGEGSPI